jgi:hydrogenase maturation protein HypF
MLNREREPLPLLEIAGSPIIRLRIEVGGIVQGVGFRPFVHSIATRLGLGGSVRNDSRGVTIEIEGGPHRLETFLDRLQSEAPPLAVIEHFATTTIAASGQRDFNIVASTAGEGRSTLVAPDIATCDECVGEIFNSANRRYRYPFNNCTNCGPRFSIVRDVPYDRPLTTMADFVMCADCAREYHDPGNRRFHAQPISCHKCGPTLILTDRFGARLDGDPIRVTADLLRAGHVVAIKGIGGYHLAVDATNESAVATLRQRKYREDKPFAVMVNGIESARSLAELDDCEERLLLDGRRPIVLLRRRSHAHLADSAPGTRDVGLILPYTPAHHLLCAEAGLPIVLTSGNISDEPIAHIDREAYERLGNIAEFFLTHDRAIHTRADDSVMRVFRGREFPLRRSRGYAPQPISLPWNVRHSVLACGAELKNTFCFVKGHHAFLSHHIGNLENYATLQAFTEGIEHYRRLFAIDPSIVAYDLHPEYLSTKYALELEGVELIGVQHHHAHIAACLADNREEGPAIGVAFDGLGYGMDSTMWGGEFLVADLQDFERVGHFETVAMPGGAIAIKQPWRMAAAYLDALYADAIPSDLEVVRRNARHWKPIVQLARAKLNAPLTSSVGRLFDAVAALLGIRDRINYEGQAAIELEQQAIENEYSEYETGGPGGERILLRGTDLIRAVVEDLRDGTPAKIIAARFHNTLAQMIVETCAEIRSRRGLEVIALSGGVFQNMLLLDRTVSKLEHHGFRVLTHSRVPTNDGGISFGQAAVAAARSRPNK